MCCRVGWRRGRGVMAPDPDPAPEVICVHVVTDGVWTLALASQSSGQPV